jgi:hypothetical protein
MIYVITSWPLYIRPSSVFSHIGSPPGALKGLKDIGDWYVKKYYTYIQIYGATGAPHLLPKYVPDKLLAREIAYQTIEKGATAYLSEKNKKYWPIFPIQVGSYSLENKKQDEKEVEALKELCLYLGEPKSHDPQNVVYEHMKVVKLAPQTMHESQFSEDVFEVH